MPKIEIKSRAGLLPLGMFSFRHEVADVVIAEVAVYRLHGGVAWPRKKKPGEVRAPGVIGRRCICVSAWRRRE